MTNPPANPPANPRGLLDPTLTADDALRVEVRDATRIVLQQTLTGRGIIGRAADAAIRLDRGTVSRQHAEIVCDPFGRWWIRDLGSRNGLVVNGQRVPERAIRTGEVYQVGEFTVRFTLPASHETPAAPPPAGGYKATASIPDQPAMSGISTAEDLGTPKVAASHLSMLIDAGRDLMAHDQADARLVLLCQLMLRPAFKGICSMALRVLPGQLESPLMLCPLQSASGHLARMPISRSLLRTVLDRNAPAMAGTTSMISSDTPGLVQMSIVSTVKPICAMACPLRSNVADGATDVLYVVFPPECATGEWLAIVALATEQYRLVESAWVERTKALQHAQIERDLEQASQIQSRLLPKDLRVSGLDVAVGFHPCRWVAGDYADAIVLQDGRVFLCVADVCGKGLAAALVASGVQTLVRAMLDDGAGIDRLMNRLNRFLVGYADDGRFVTMTCATVDPKTGRIEHINAGHPSIILAEQSGKVREVDYGQYLPLGIEMDQFVIAEDRLEPGQMLALYSDGLTEARTANGEMVGDEACWKQLGAIHAASAEQPLTSTRNGIKSWLEAVSGGMLQDDDRTYLLARRG